MNRQPLVYVAVVVSMLYGVGFTVFHNTAYIVIGAVICAAAWMAVTMLPRRENPGRERNRNRQR